MFLIIIKIFRLDPTNTSKDLFWIIIFIKRKFEGMLSHFINTQSIGLSATVTQTYSTESSIAWGKDLDSMHCSHLYKTFIILSCKASYFSSRAIFYFYKYGHIFLSIMLKISCKSSNMLTIIKQKSQKKYI